MKIKNIKSILLKLVGAVAPIAPTLTRSLLYLDLIHFSCTLKEKCKSTNITSRLDFEAEISEEARNSKCPGKGFVCCHFENIGELIDRILFHRSVKIVVCMSIFESIY